MIIQFKSILVYLGGNLTAQKPITKLAEVRRKKERKKERTTETYKNIK
jgi:hypothetical protein